MSAVSDEVEIRAETSSTYRRPLDGDHRIAGRGRRRGHGAGPGQFRGGRVPR